MRLALAGVAHTELPRTRDVTAKLAQRSQIWKGNTRGLTDKIGDGLEKAAAKLAELHRKGRTAGELTAIDDYRITSLLLDEHSGNGSYVPFEITDAALHQSEENFKLMLLRLSNLQSEELAFVQVGHIPTWSFAAPAVLLQYLPCSTPNDRVVVALLRAL